jgi:hypothetical protein
MASAAPASASLLLISFPFIDRLVAAMIARRRPRVSAAQKTAPHRKARGQRKSPTYPPEIAQQNPNAMTGFDRNEQIRNRIAHAANFCSWSNPSEPDKRIKGRQGAVGAKQWMVIEVVGACRCTVLCRVAAAAIDMGQRSRLLPSRRLGN